MTDNEVLYLMFLCLLCGICVGNIFGMWFERKGAILVTRFIFFIAKQEYVDVNKAFICIPKVMLRHTLSTIKCDDPEICQAGTRCGNCSTRLWLERRLGESERNHE